MRFVLVAIVCAVSAVGTLRAQELFEDEVPFGDEFVSGIDTGPTGFRRDTPALLRSDFKVRHVDQEQLYRRKRAMYDDRATFTQPMRAVGYADSRIRQTKLKRPVTIEPHSGGYWPVIGIALAVMLGMFVLVRRARLS